MARKKVLSQKELFNKLYIEYSQRYLIPLEEIKHIINQALTKTYNSALPVVVDDKNITITVIKNGVYELKKIVISQKKEKQFATNLSELIISHTIKTHTHTLRSILKNTNNILYAAPVQFNQTTNELTLQLYNSNKSKINNFFIIVKQNNLFSISYKNDNLYIVSPIKNFYPIHKDGKFYIYGTTKNTAVVKAIVLGVFKKVNEVLPKKYLVQNVIFNNETITIFLKQNHIDKQIAQKITEHISQRTGCKTVLITNKQKGNINNLPITKNDILRDIHFSELNNFKIQKPSNLETAIIQNQEEEEPYASHLFKTKLEPNQG